MENPKKCIGLRIRRSAEFSGPTPGGEHAATEQTISREGAKDAKKSNRLYTEVAESAEIWFFEPPIFTNLH
jgi:hypothetical protein